MTLMEAPTSSAALEKILNAARQKIQVTEGELHEARRRRGAITKALRREFPGSRAYVNGSIAHGDALTPLTDVDLGVVVPDPDHTYGPGKMGRLLFRSGQPKPFASNSRLTTAT
jgi:hypothetical protein